jgi:hypothetical protein
MRNSRITCDEAVIAFRRYYTLALLSRMTGTQAAPPKRSASTATP